MNNFPGMSNVFGSLLALIASMYLPLTGGTINGNLALNGNETVNAVNANSLTITNTLNVIGASGGSPTSNLGANALANSYAFGSSGGALLGREGTIYGAPGGLHFATGTTDALVLDNSQNATFNANVTVSYGGFSATSDAFGHSVPNAADRHTYYKFWEYNEWTDVTTPVGNFLGSGNRFLSTGFSSGAPIFAGINPNNIEIIYVSTTSATAGGAIGGPGTVTTTKSAAIQYQWRAYFMFPTALSTAANRYTFAVGSQYLLGVQNYAGPFISYTDSVNSGNWVLNTSNAGSVTASFNTTTAVPAVSTWHNLTITLNNAVFTYILDGTTLGTVTDPTLTGGSAGGAAAGGSLYLNPNATWTTTVYTAMDTSDVLVTGLNR